MSGDMTAERNGSSLPVPSENTANSPFLLLYSWEMGVRKGAARDDKPAACSPVQLSLQSGSLCAPDSAVLIEKLEQKYQEKTYLGD